VQSNHSLNQEANLIFSPFAISSCSFFIIIILSYSADYTKAFTLNSRIYVSLGGFCFNTWKYKSPEFIFSY
jgi:hypothetical protein